MQCGRCINYVAVTVCVGAGPGRNDQSNEQAASPPSRLVGWWAGTAHTLVQRGLPSMTKSLANPIWLWMLDSTTWRSSICITSMTPGSGRVIQITTYSVTASVRSVALQKFLLLLVQIGQEEFFHMGSSLYASSNDCHIGDPSSVGYFEMFLYSGRSNPYTMLRSLTGWSPILIHVENSVRWFYL